jgi:hypothetical protein
VEKEFSKERPPAENASMNRNMVTAVSLKASDVPVMLAVSSNNLQPSDVEMAYDNSSVRRMSEMQHR